MAITPPRQGVTDPTAQYDVWVMDSWSGVLNYNTLNLQTRQLGSQSVDIGDASNFNDWWPVPIPSDPNSFQVFLAVDTSNWRQPGGQMQLYEWNGATNTFTKQGWQPGAAQQILQVRVATLAAALPDDPDKDQQPANFVGSTIVYGTVASSTDIFVWVSGWGKQASVPIPMNVYSGIAVDPHFLWMYGAYGFACATHASVLSYINGTRSGMPLWLGNGQPNNIANVLDLSSCEDGTLFVLGPNNQAVTSVYQVEFNRPNKGIGEWVVIDGWEPVPGGGGVECQKLPIFGWARAQGLATVLSQPVNLPPKLS